MLKRLSLFLVFSSFLIGMVGCTCKPAVIGSLPVTLHPQETQNWCWAASGQMVMDYLGHNVSQCTEANNRFGRTSAPLTWDQLREQISNESYCKKKPFAFSWGWLGGGGHMMVAKGYLTLAGTNYVVIMDPWAPCVGDERIITYDFYNADPTDHTHWDDYYDVTYTGGK
ncbi:MAG: hypothetical protein HZC10_01535 [Nitrospirae bacterium]|nr:hypothetical protein [Nitrospirota bacterium]